MLVKTTDEAIFNTHTRARGKNIIQLLHSVVFFIGTLKQLIENSFHLFTFVICPSKIFSSKKNYGEYSPYASERGRCTPVRYGGRVREIAGKRFEGTKIDRAQNTHNVRELNYTYFRK